MELADMKQRVELHSLANTLGLTRPDANGNYKSPHHDDKSPSLSIYTGSDGVQRWQDFSADKGGDCFDLVQYVQGTDQIGAINYIRQLYGFPKQASNQPAQRMGKLDFIASQCAKAPQKAIAYLAGRGISEATLQKAIDRKTLGFNDYINPARQIGDVGYGGDAVAFICRDNHTGEALGIDYRYLDPKLNGNVKTKSQGEKQGVIWTSCWHRLRQAHTVVIVESATNALSAETAWDAVNRKGFAALAIRGTQNANCDWSVLIGKRVIICTDNDEPIEQGPLAGYSPGLRCAWALHEALTKYNIPALLVDHSEWQVNDLNDFLQANGEGATRTALSKLEQWLIPGQLGKMEGAKPRLFLPAHDAEQYWRYRVQPDFTSVLAVSKDENGEDVFRNKDVAGFRIAALSRIQIASANATMTGQDDAMPTTVFAAAVQTPRHGNTLLRKVINDDSLYTPQNWSKFGPVFAPQPFLRAINLWERAVDIGQRKAANFVGLCFREGKPAVNEGQDCYFTEPEKQCPYHNLQFPSGSVANAQQVITAYQNTMGNNAATLLLTWALGGHLKAYLGFWPHMMLQADKSAGKSTLIKALERSISFTMFSGQSLNTEFRLVTSISHTSHPVGWEELSARQQVVIDKAVALLQETYNWTINRRGSDMTEFLLSAPVLLAGEDVPVDSLQGKIIRCQLRTKGQLIPSNLPNFPVREWLQFLSQTDPIRVRDLTQKIEQRLQQKCISSINDSGAQRMVGNYAAIGTAWMLLCEFAGIAVEQGNFTDDMAAEMNSHIMETKATREPWVWILELILSEIDRHEYKYPHVFQTQDDGDTWLLLRATHCMNHVSGSPALRQKYDALPVKSARVFASQLRNAGVIAAEGVERTIYNQRVAHLQAISLNKLAEYGLSVSIPNYADMEK